MTSASTQRAEKSPGIDRRAAVRHFVRPDVTGTASVAKNQRPWKAVIHDLSTTGIGLFLNQSFDPKTDLAVELYSPDMLLCYTVLTRVVHCSRQSNGSWLVGCRFVRELSEDELQNLL